MITGRTSVIVVIGDPVVQVKAPMLMNAEFARLGLDAVLTALHVAPERLDAVLGGLRHVGNLLGVLVTVPHKVAVRELAEEVGPAAEAAGSANALRRRPDGTWFADNFDGAGFVSGLRGAGHDPAGMRIGVAGAGGAGSAIAVALLEAGAGDLVIWDRDVARLGVLRARLEARWPRRARFGVQPALGELDLAVNATPLGLREGDELPFDPAALPPGAVVADIVMEPRLTRLLRVAEDAGRKIHFGEHMLVSQVPHYLRFFGLVEN